MLEMIQITYTEATFAPGLCIPMGREKSWWRVLEVNREVQTAVLIAEQSVGEKEYNETYIGVTWETCTLRQWLNGEYYDKTFTEEEKEAILESEISNPDNPEYKTKGGNDTKDKLYLLSLDEVLAYFKDDKDRATCKWWWLRSPGYFQSSAAYVYSNGFVDGYGGRVSVNSVVRPAFKINLKSSFFQSLISDSANPIIKVPDCHIVGSKLISVRKGQTVITIPEGVTEIGESCFAGMGELRDVIIPKTVRQIEKEAFSGCTSLRQVKLPEIIQRIYDTDITEAGAKKLVRIGDCVLQDNTLYCQGMTEITILEGVTEIGESCFSGMGELKKVILPSTLKKIGKAAFEKCTSLEEITGGSGAITYGKYIFYDCCKLKYTPDMFRNTGKLCDSFASHMENCGPEEYAWILTYQKGAVWEQAMGKAVNADHAPEILSCMTEHIKEQKKSPKKAATAAVDFVIKNALLLSKEGIEALIEVLRSQKLVELAENLQADPTVSQMIGAESDKPQNDTETVPRSVQPDGSIWYGMIRIKLAKGACFRMGIDHTNWRILSIDENSEEALVIADESIGETKYHDKREDIAWENCALRKWLNGEYYEETFTEEEKEAILESEISNPDNPRYHTKGGNDTKDKLYLLSLEEVQTYFKNDEDRATGEWWWLRSPGDVRSSAAGVDRHGHVYGVGNYGATHCAVRPAFKINLKSSFFQSLLSSDSNGEAVIRNPEIVVKNGRLIDIDKNCTEVVLPSFVTEIPGMIFCKAMWLKKIVISESVKVVERYAFTNCSMLESLEIRNPNLRFEKYAFGGETDWGAPAVLFPKGLVPDVFEISLYMAPEDVRDIVLNKKIWNSLKAEQQAELFLRNQTKFCQTSYKKLLTKKNSEGMAESIGKEIRSNYSAKECNAVAFFMTEFADLIPVHSAKVIYVKLKECKKAESALKAIESCESIMARINASDSGEIVLSKEEKVLQNVLESRNLSKSTLEIKLKEYFGLDKDRLPEILYQDGSKANPDTLAFLLVAHGIGGHAFEACYEKTGVRAEAQMVIDLLDRNSFMAALKNLGDTYLVKYQNSKQKFLTFPICRYADEELMKELTKRAPGWKTAVSGIDAPPLWTFRGAIRYSDTKSAMMFADKMHELDSYAKLRGLSEDDFRDVFLSDIGLDEDGRKEYDLGSQKVTAVLQRDMSFLIETEDGKTMKSVPKKDADPELYARAADDFKNIKSQAKKIVKNRANTLFEDFLSGNARPVENWKRAYLENRLLRSVAEHIVWSQGPDTFIVSGKETIDQNGGPYVLKDDIKIMVAHPMELKAEIVLAWQEYLKVNKISQPFEQIWEPAYRESEIREDRYEGCSIFWRRVQNADKHGIHFVEADYHSYNIGLDDCNLEHELDGQLRHEVADNAVFVLGKFEVKAFTRKANHIIYLLDKWTIWDRIRKDDVKVMELIGKYNAAQITEFIDVAIESKATQLTAALMTYKTEHFESYDAFDEFVLEW